MIYFHSRIFGHPASNKVIRIVFFEMSQNSSVVSFCFSLLFRKQAKKGRYIFPPEKCDRRTLISLYAVRLNAISLNELRPERLCCMRCELAIKLVTTEDFVTNADSLSSRRRAVHVWFNGDVYELV